MGSRRALAQAMRQRNRPDEWEDLRSRIAIDALPWADPPIVTLSRWPSRPYTWDEAVAALRSAGADR